MLIAAGYPLAVLSTSRQRHHSFLPSVFDPHFWRNDLVDVQCCMPFIFTFYKLKASLNDSICTVPFSKPKYFHVGLNLLQQVVVIDSNKNGMPVHLRQDVFSSRHTVAQKSASFLASDNACITPSMQMNLGRQIKHMACVVLLRVHSVVFPQNMQTCSVWNGMCRYVLASCDS